MKDCKKTLQTSICRQLDNLNEVDKFIEICNFPKLNQEESQNLNRQIKPSQFKAVNKQINKKNPADQKSPGRDGFMGDFYQTFPGH